MKENIVKNALVLLTFIAFLSVWSLSFAEENNTGEARVEQGVAGLNMEDSKVAGPEGFSVETSFLIAGNYDVGGSTTTTTSPTKGRDGAACSDNDECKSNVCEGGSCCTNYGDPCNEYSHCCGHQSCTNGTCPE